MIFCPQCGLSNVDNAVVCTQCGRPLQAGASATGVVIPPGTATVPNYLVFAILSTVLCCLPTGIPAIVYASQVNTKLALGDVAGAQAASNNAKMWCWISFGLGLATAGFWIVLSMVGVLGHLHPR